MRSLRPLGRTALVILAYAPTISVPFVVAALVAWAPAGHECAHVKVQVRFAPGADPANQIVWAINQADKSVRVMAYSFTDGDIADALIRAKARGVDVQVMVDEKQSHGRGCVVPMLLKAGIPVHADAKHPIFHHKTIILDSRRTFCGSYNFSGQAKHNAEASLDIIDRRVASRFASEWDMHIPHANPLVSSP